MLTLQQIFDKALSGVRAQGGASATPGLGSCRYRSRDGQRACGVGHLIPDNAYDLAFDECAVSSVRTLVRLSTDFMAALAQGGIDVSDPSVLDLLEELQVVHDRAAGGLANPRTDEEFLPAFNTNMRRLADRLGLVYQ